MDLSRTGDAQGRRPYPPIDTDTHADVRTATFALG